MDKAGRPDPKRVAAMRAAVERLRPYARLREGQRNDPEAWDEIEELMDEFGPLRARAMQEVLRD